MRATPGTAEWLREMAEALKNLGGDEVRQALIRSVSEATTDVVLSGELTEGLARAANRIDRLSGAVSKAKTGVDQTANPPLAMPSNVVADMDATMRNLARVANIPSERVRVELPDSDAVYEAIFEWVQESESTGLGTLEAMTLVTYIDPSTLVDTDLRPERPTLKLKKLLPPDRRQKHVRIERDGHILSLLECTLHDVEESDGITVITLGARSKR